jgi:hypothetical protein
MFQNLAKNCRHLPRCTLHCSQNIQTLKCCELTPYHFYISSGSQWPRGLRRGSSAALLVRLRVRIPPGGMDVCCVLEVSATGRSLVQRSPTDCGVSEWDREASIMNRPWPNRGCCAMEEKELLPLFGHSTMYVVCIVFTCSDGLYLDPMNSVMTPIFTSCHSTQYKLFTLTQRC